MCVTGVAGNAVNQLNGPRDLKFDRYGNIHVTDQDNHRIQKSMIQVSAGDCFSKCIFYFLILKFSFLLFRRLNKINDQTFHKHL